MEIFLKNALPILIAGVVFVIRLEGKFKMLSQQITILTGEYKSMLSEYRKLNELFLEMREQVNTNTAAVRELQLLKAALVVVKDEKD